MLSAEAARLAALEVLCPKAALDADDGYPTLARARVFDCRSVGLDDLDKTEMFTPVLSLYTPDSASAARGAIADATDTDARASLDIVAELAVAARDEDGTLFADAMAGDDWEARLVLAALCAQVRKLLTDDPRGYLFRRFVRQVERVTEETFAIPQLGARWQRITMRFDLSLPDDEFTDAAGLPEPLKALAALLPDGSAAAAKLAVLAGHFTGTTRTPFEGVDFTAAGKDEPRGIGMKADT
jgi:hypothetical protein